MFMSFRIATLIYAFAIFTGGYVVAATMHEIWTQTGEVQAKVQAADGSDFILINPAAGLN